MRFFNYFCSRELFPNCSESEIMDCINKCYLDNLLVLFQVLDSFRDSLGQPIFINSTYRNEEHNKRVGGSEFSQHMYGSAIDFRCPFVPFDTLSFLFCEFLQKCALEKFIGQVIFYHKRQFIHIGLRTQNLKHYQIYHYEQRDN